MTYVRGSWQWLQGRRTGTPYCPSACPTHCHQQSFPSHHRPPLGLNSRVDGYVLLQVRTNAQLVTQRLCTIYCLNQLFNAPPPPPTLRIQFLYIPVVLQLSTPEAFQQALNDTEQWAAACIYAAAAAGSNKSSIAPADVTASFVSQSSDLKLEIPRDISFSSTIYEDSLSPLESPANPLLMNNTSSQSQKGLSEGAGTGAGLIGRFKMLGSKIFAATAPIKADANSSLQAESPWPHECKREAGTMCLWSSPKEVVPFISSSSRAALPPFESIQHHFQEGVLAVSAVEDVSDESKQGSKGTGRMTFPPLTELSYTKKEGQSRQTQSTAGITFFGIDCRDEKERSLGLFPRVCMLNVYVPAINSILALELTH